MAGGGRWWWPSVATIVEGGAVVATIGEGGAVAVVTVSGIYFFPHNGAHKLPQTAQTPSSRDGGVFGVVGDVHIGGITMHSGPEQPNTEPLARPFARSLAPLTR